MLISHKNRFVFVHNPKVAGTSFRNMLCENFECEDRRFGAIVDGVMQDQAHLRIDQWPLELWNLYIEGYYFFGMVRNPVDRFMSSMSEFWYQHQDLIANFGADYEEALAALLTPNSIAYDVRFIHFTEQWRFFDYAPSVWGENQNLDIDVYPFETMNEWINREDVLANLGATKPLKIRNDRPSFHRKKELAPFLKRMIPFLYRADYEMFEELYGESPFVHFLSHTHSHRLEFVHRYPGTTEPEKLNERETNALKRDKPKLESMSAMLLEGYATRATILRRAKKEANV